MIIYLLIFGRLDLFELRGLSKPKSKQGRKPPAPSFQGTLTYFSFSGCHVATITVSAELGSYLKTGNESTSQFIQVVEIQVTEVRGLMSPFHLGCQPEAASSSWTLPSSNSKSATATTHQSQAHLSLKLLCPNQRKGSLLKGSYGWVRPTQTISI